MDDIVTRLRKMNCYVNGVAVCINDKAADEIEQLRKALALAVGELSTYAPYGDRSPENLFEFFKEAGRND